MSGHSKWSKVKHQKAVTDAAKGSAFTKASRAITIAVREGGGITDPVGNIRLRFAIEQARAVNMPRNTIERAIERAKGADAGELAEVLYEAYGPGGTAMLIESTTDNRQRTVSLVKNILERFGGSLATPGSVQYQFDRMGVITVEKHGQSLDTVLGAAIAAGADDVSERDDVFELTCDPTKLLSVKEKLLAAGLRVDHVLLAWLPKSPVAVSADSERRLVELKGQLEASDDIQTVYTNTTQ